jgi:hypothetical protein
MEISAEDPVVADLRVLADRGVAVDTLRGCQALVELICSERLTDLKHVNGKSCDLLLQKVEQIVSRVALGARKQAYEARNRVKKGRMPAACQAAALTELLKIPIGDDSGYFELMAASLDDRLWSARKDLAEKRNNAGQLTARAVEVRMGVWLGGQSDRTVRQKETRTDCFVGFANIISTEVVSLATAEQAEIKELCRQLSNRDEDRNTKAAPCSPVAAPEGPTYDMEEPEIRRTLTELAEAVHRQLQAEEGRDRFSLAIRWVNASDNLVDHWDNIRGVQGDTDPIELAGSLDEIVEKFYSIPSGRFVVLGKGGAGKTMLAVKLALALFKRERGESAGQIPIILDVASWDPAKQAFRDWMSQRIAVDYLGLKRINKEEEKLVSRVARYMFPILDGFDEIAPELRPVAIRALSSASNFKIRLLITSRPREYIDAVDDSGVLSGAAAVRLLDLNLDDVASYLPLTARKLPHDSGSRTKWDEVLSFVRSRNNEAQAVPLLEALLTPLMVSIAREIYSDTAADPSELLDFERFPDAAAISDYLFDRFVDLKYDQLLPSDDARLRNRSWSSRHAKNWLSYISVYLHSIGGHRSFAWWTIRWDGTTGIGFLLFVAGVAAFTSAIADRLPVLDLVGWGCASVGLGLVQGGMATPRKLSGRSPLHRVRTLGCVRSTGDLLDWLCPDGIYSITWLPWMFFLVITSLTGAKISASFVVITIAVVAAAVLVFPVGVSDRIDLRKIPGNAVVLRDDRIAALVRGAAAGAFCVGLSIAFWLAWGEMPVLYEASIFFLIPFVSSIFASVVRLNSVI